MDIDLSELDQAAQRIARAENVAVFHGWAPAGITGVAEATPHAPLTLGSDFANYPGHVARAVELLLENGIERTLRTGPGTRGIHRGGGDH